MSAPKGHCFLNLSRAVIFLLSVLQMFPPISPAQAPGGGHAPATSATQRSSSTSLLSTNADEVSFDLTVRTKHKKPVLDLQPSQLMVTDDGSPVPLSSLHLVANASGSQHLISLVFDHLDPAAAKTARKIAAKILGAIPGTGYSVAVFQVNGRLRLLQPFTADLPLIDAAIADATSTSSAPPSADLTPAEKTLIASVHSDALTLNVAQRAQGKLLLSAIEESQRILEDRRSYPSLAALQAIVDSDRLLTGRKFIFYFSEYLPTNHDARDMVRSITGLASRAGVNIYPVDISRFNERMVSAYSASMATMMLGFGSAGGSSSAFGGGSSFTPGAANGPVGAVDMSGFESGGFGADQSPLVALAYGTGGIYFSGSGGSKHQLRQLREDLTTWYQATWVPPIKNYDGQFRPVKIHPLRKGIVVHARSGYFAVPPTEASGIRPFEMPLLNILAKPALPTDVVFRTGILHLGALADGNSAELSVQVPVSHLEIHEDASTHISTAHATIVAVIKDSKGNVLQRFGEDYPLHETPDMFRADSGQTITLERQFSADPGVYTLETAVLDQAANKAGAQRTTFTMEPPQHSPALSDMALVERIEPVQDDDQTFDPMRFRNGRIVPSLAAELPKDARSVSFFFLIHPVASSQSQPTLRMQILRNGHLLTEAPMDLDKVSGTGAAIPYLCTIGGRVILPGEYEIKTLLSQNGSTASHSVSFHVEGAMASSNAPSASLTAAGSSSADPINSALVSEASTVNSSFIITSPKNPIPPPSQAEIEAMIEGARKRALAWSDSIENFFCIEVTDHSVDKTGLGDWQHKDTLVELIRHVDHDENRTTLMLNGDRSSVQPDQLQFAHSAGEFGGMFHIIFSPSAKAVFTWERSAFLDGQPVQVFAFRVARANSSFYLSDRNNHTRTAGFHGTLYLDPATGGIHRISIDADDIPHALLIRAASMSIDYSWVAMENHDFLLPLRGAVSLQETRRRPVLNEFQFLNYHRFGSQAHIVTADELKALSKN